MTFAFTLENLSLRSVVQRALTLWLTTYRYVWKHPWIDDCWTPYTNSYHYNIIVFKHFHFKMWIADWLTNFVYAIPLWYHHLMNIFEFLWRQSCHIDVFSMKSLWICVSFVHLILLIQIFVCSTTEIAVSHTALMHSHPLYIYCEY